jgi:hypothetical protein
MTIPVALQRSAANRVAAPPPRGANSSWIFAYVAFQFLCQLALLLPELNAIRVVVRSGAVLGAGALLLLVPWKAATQGSGLKRWCYAIVITLLLGAINPEGNGVVAAVAQIGLYVATIGPVFWVSRLELTERHFRGLIVALWLFYSASALFGVLQVYFPGSFQPALSTIVADRSKDIVASLQIQLSSGERVFRPMGLTDLPGGAAYGGLYAVVLGLGIFQGRENALWLRSLAVGSMLLGAICLYVCQVRSLVVMGGVCLVTMVGLQALSGRVSRSLGAATTLLAVLPLALSFALSLADRAVSERLSTLTERGLSDVYYSSRGHFLESTIDNLLPRYPLGAGLGRWGMVSRYFGSRANNIWVEIQWTGWLLDGGVPLILAYAGAIMVASYGALRLALRREYGHMNSWAALVVAYNVGAFALCFSYAPFIGTAGIEFWLLNAALIQAARYEASAPAAINLA